MNFGGLDTGGCVADAVVAGVVVSIDGGTQLEQHSGMSQSIIQSTTNVCRGLGRRSHNSLAMAPENLFPDRPIKPKIHAIRKRRPTVRPGRIEISKTRSNGKIDTHRNLVYFPWKREWYPSYSYCQSGRNAVPAKALCHHSVFPKNYYR